MSKYKYLYLFILSITGTLQLSGQNVTFQASAPSVVSAGQRFQVTYTVNDAEAKNFRDPNFGELDMMFGPSSSRSMSSSMINGKVTTSSAMTFTYVVQAQKEGTYNISPATVTVDGKSYSSNALTIKALPAGQNAPPGNQSGSNSASRGNSNASATSQDIASDDLFFRASVSKSSVYEQEGLVLTYKLFSRYDRTVVESLKYSNHEGFMTQELELPATKSWQMEVYNGKSYNTVVLNQVLLFPQRSGTITIEPSKLGAIVGVYVPAASRNPFSLPMAGYQEVKKTLMTSAIKIDVKPLPAGKPASFSGTAGSFTMSSSLLPGNPKTNEAVTFKLTFQGNGNLKLIKNPEVKFPADFETYDPKVDNNFKSTTSGMSGFKTIEYMAIPRHAGDFVIPSIEFSYFDLRTQSYKTERTPEYKLHVEKGSGSAAGTVVGNYTDKEMLKLLNEDIRYIKTGNLNIKPYNTYTFGTLTYYLWYIVPLLAAVILFIVFRKQAKENANMALVRTKKANKVAGKRLKKAAGYMKEHKKEEFYDETLKALWGYLSDKLSIPVSELSKNNVEVELGKYGVNDDLIADFTDILGICEFARYAPVDEERSMDKIYQRACDAINGMENTIKKRNN